MKKLLALLLAVIMIFALAACGPTEGSGEGEGGEGPQYGGHVNISSNNITGILDPCNVAKVYHYANLIWESPLARNADGTIAPGVCNFELSDDQLTLKLWVRDGMKFHDGTDVTIDDVVASIMRKGHKSPVQYVINMLAEPISVSSDGVATLKFKSYSEKTMYYMACTNVFIAVLPKWFCEKYPGNAANPKLCNVDVADAIGTGPYKCDSERDGEWIKMVRFDGYVKNDAKYTGAAAPKNAYLDSITFVNRTDSTAHAIQLLANDLDAINAAYSDYKNSFESSNLTQTKKLGSNTMFLLFNNTNQDNNVHDDINLRKAICAALDFIQINSVLWDNTYVLGGAPATDGTYYLDNWDKADYIGAANVQLAQQYLAKSNYKGEELYYLTADANEGALVQHYLNAAGINVKVDVKSDTGDTLLDGKNYWDFQFMRGSAGNSPSTIVANGYNRGWTNAEKDALIKTIAETVPGSKDYMDAWKELAELWVGECVSVFLGHDVATWTHHKDLVIDYDGSMIYMWNWYWKNPSAHAEK